MKIYNLNKQQKLLAIIFLTVVFAVLTCILGVRVFYSNDENPEDLSQAKSILAAKVTDNDKLNANKKESTGVKQFDLRIICPFVKHNSVIKNQNTNNGQVVENSLQDKALPAIPAGYRNFPQQNIQQPVPFMSVKSIPANKTDMGISGILTGSEGEKSIAIMANGKIVSEGDNLNGKKISVINSQGIQFANGGSIAYEIK